jgi:signal transduction histidine kinase
MRLEHAVNQLAIALAAADQQRRDLIVNESRESRTPITALNGVLDNLVDGVAETGQETLASHSRRPNGSAGCCPNGQKSKTPRESASATQRLA